jgi:hypothetical protein
VQGQAQQPNQWGRQAQEKKPGQSEPPPDQKQAKPGEHPTDQTHAPPQKKEKRTNPSFQHTTEQQGNKRETKRQTDTFSSSKPNKKRTHRLIIFHSKDKHKNYFSYDTRLQNLIQRLQKSSLFKNGTTKPYKQGRIFALHTTLLYNFQYFIYGFIIGYLCCFTSIIQSLLPRAYLSM